jgi:hypothetical protein
VNLIIWAQIYCLFTESPNFVLNINSWRFRNVDFGFRNDDDTIYTQRISDLGLWIAESIDNQHIPQSAIPNPKSHEYIGVAIPQSEIHIPKSNYFLNL